MQVDLKDFSVHLGSHDYGIEGMKDLPQPQDHKLSEPTEGVEGLVLPFITFAAKDKEAADFFVRRLNHIAAQYRIDALDLANLVYAADRLTGK